VHFENMTLRIGSGDPNLAKHGFHLSDVQTNPLKSILIGGIPIPLKNDGGSESQLG